MEHLTKVNDVKGQMPVTPVWYLQRFFPDLSANQYTLILQGPSPMLFI